VRTPLIDHVQRKRMNVAKRRERVNLGPDDFGVPVDPWETGRLANVLCELSEVVT